MHFRILIADDNTDDAALLQHALRAVSAEVTIHAVIEGDAVLAELRDHSRFDLVILDHYLPRTNALEIVEQLRQLRSLPLGPLVVLTSHIPQPQRDALLKAGVTAVMEKPMDWEGFLELARVLLAMPPRELPSD